MMNCAPTALQSELPNETLERIWDLASYRRNAANSLSFSAPAAPATRTPPARGLARRPAPRTRGVHAPRVRVVR